MHQTSNNNPDLSNWIEKTNPIVFLPLPYFLFIWTTIGTAIGSPSEPPSEPPSESSATGNNGIHSAWTTVSS